MSREKFWYVPDEHKRAYFDALGAVARTSEDVEGYQAFYELVHGHPPPRHVVDVYMRTIFEADEDEKGALIFASRGYWKTDAITVIWGAWQIGLHPERANLVIQVNDEKAEASTESIADIIANADGWKAAFPHVVPDKGKGWGAKGYEVMCTHRFEYDAEVHEQRFVPIGYEEWRGMNDTRKDPTLKGVGYKSGSIIGNHPDGFLVIDDIHDISNTESQLEVQSVVQRVRDVILPIRVMDESGGTGRKVKTKMVVVGTPWTLDDVYHALKKTGRFVVREVPVMVSAAPHVEGAVWVDYQKLKGWYKLTWPERFGIESVEREYDLSGYRGFMRMYMLTIISASEAGVSYVTFPVEDLDTQRLIVTGGLDYASIMESRGRTLKNQSYFAYYWCVHLPQGGVVVVDGVLEQLTQAQAEVHMTKVQNMHPMFRHAYFELDGKGADGYAGIMGRNPDLRIVGDTVKGMSKAHRFETYVVPELESGAMMIGDADTPAMQGLKKALEDYPFGLWDPLDALYWVVQSAQDALARVRPAVVRANDPMREKRKHPFNMKQKRGIYA